MHLGCNFTHTLKVSHIQYQCIVNSVLECIPCFAFKSPDLHISVQHTRLSISVQRNRSKELTILLLSSQKQSLEFISCFLFTVLHVQIQYMGVGKVLPAVLPCSCKLLFFFKAHKDVLCMAHKDFEGTVEAVLLYSGPSSSLAPSPTIFGKFKRKGLLEVFFKKNPIFLTKIFLWVKHRSRCVSLKFRERCEGRSQSSRS